MQIIGSLEPLLLTGGAAAAVVAGAGYARVKRQQPHDANRRTYLCTYPYEVKHDAVLNFVRVLHGLDKPALARPVSALVFEVFADDTGIRHYLSVPPHVVEDVEGQLRTHIPSTSMVKDEPAFGAWDYGLELRLTGFHKPLRIGSPEAVVASVLATFSPLKPGEALLLQWVISPSRPQPPLPKKDKTRWPLEDADRDQHKAKHNDHTFLAVPRIAARGPRARQLVKRVESGLASTSQHGTMFRRARWLSGPVTWIAPVDGQAQALVKDRIRRRAVPLVFPCHLNAAELTAVLGIPFGSPNIAGLPRGRARHLAADTAIPASGLGLATSTYPGAERPLAIRNDDLDTHMHILGKTGTGKSTLMANMAAQQMKRGEGIGMIEPTGDLVPDVLALVPEERIKDVVLFEPTQEDYAVPFNVFAGTRNPEVVADQLMAIFHGIYRDNGIYANNYLRGAIQALASVPGMTLVDVLPFFEDAAFRAAVVAQVKDPVIRDTWQRFDKKPTSEQRQLVMPAIHRVQPLLMRASVRRALGQSNNKLDMEWVIRNRKILLVNLPRTLGEETATLFGSLFFARIYQAAQAIPKAERPGFTLYLDEAQNFMNMPLSLGSVLDEARKYKLRLVLANQRESHIPHDIRSAISTNTRHKAIFRVNSDDALNAAKEMGPPLTPTDFTALGAYEFVMQTTTDGLTSAPATAKALPPIEPLTDPERVRAVSRELWAEDAEVIEEAIRTRRKCYGRSKAPVVGEEE